MNLPAPFGTGKFGLEIFVSERIRVFIEADNGGDTAGSQRVWETAYSAAQFLVSGAIDPRGLRVLDFGAGTGFLSILAVLLGGSAVATDADPRAVYSMRHNARLNNLSRFRVCDSKEEKCRGRTPRFRALSWNWSAGLHPLLQDLGGEFDLAIFSGLSFLPTDLLQLALSYCVSLGIPRVLYSARKSEKVAEFEKSFSVIKRLSTGDVESLGYLPNGFKTELLLMEQKQV